MSFIPRFFTPPAQSFFLFGPRGTGKSTLMKSLYKDALWIDLLRPDTLRSYLARPERLYETIEGHIHGRGKKGTRVVVIDEVQKAPALLPVVHSLIEEKQDLQFILTGSSARKLKRTGADLLGGRALRCILPTFMAGELKGQFSFSHALSYGLLPLLHGKPNPQEILDAYIGLYLQEEIQAEGIVRNLENFTRFLEVVSFSHGALLNVANVARECEVKRKTVENYIIILEELLLAFQLPVFTRRAQRALTAQPKFYLFDTGVFRTLRPKGPLDSPEEIDGSALEGLLAQHLKAWVEYNRSPYTLSFWRTRSGAEVDFIVYGPGGLWAIEVKNARRVSTADTKHLETFLMDYPMAKALLLYRGSEVVKLKNVLCLPCEVFLSQLHPHEDLWGAGE